MRTQNQPTQQQGDTVFRIEKDFFDQARSLRQEFQNKISQPPGLRTEESLLSYSYWPDVIYCLSGNANAFFAPDLILSLLDQLRRWARQNVDAHHASSPAVRVYVRGCSRKASSDVVKAGWHYLLCLTDGANKRPARVKVAAESVSADGGSRVVVGATRFITADLRFNDLLVHKTTQPYGLDVDVELMDPRSGEVFLDGYIW